MTQEVADVFGDAIRAHPQDWHMLQPLWLGDLAPREPR
jgi:KDO2-lipid IV(A) lauroyltransferase